MSELDANGQPIVEPVAAEPNWINVDGTFGDLSKAPEGVGDFITKKDFKDISAMTASHKELESMMGHRDRMFTIPEPGDKEGFRAMATKLGCPEKPEDYKFDIKEGDPMDTNLLNMFKQSAFNDGMPQNAFADVVQFQVDAIKCGETEYARIQTQEKEDAQKAIRERFNSEDDYNDYTQKALGFASKFKLEGSEVTAADVLERKGLAHDPEVLEVFSILANSVKEDSIPFGKDKFTPNRQDQIKAITASESFVNGQHPDHDKNMQEYWALFDVKREG
jgi:hypothetical protein